MQKFHYVYRITNIQEKKHYYGVRSSDVEPKLDLGIKYFSSSADKEFIKEQKENNNIFKYKIIKQFDSRKEAIELEIKLHNKFNVNINESFYNRTKQTSSGWDISGTQWTYDKTPEEIKEVYRKYPIKTNYRFTNNLKGMDTGQKINQKMMFAQYMPLAR